MLELKHVAGNETAGFTLEGFEEFANDTLAIEREDAMMTRKIALWWMIQQVWISPATLQSRHGLGLLPLILSILESSVNGTGVAETGLTLYTFTTSRIPGL